MAAPLGNDQAKAAGRPPSLLETVLLYYVSLEPVSGYDLCRHMKQDGVRGYFPYTEAAVYRAIQRLAARGLVTAAAACENGRQSTVYTLTATGQHSLQDSVCRHLRRFAASADAKVMMAFLYKTPTAKVLEIVQEVYVELKLHYNTVKHHLENYRGSKRIGTWTLLGYEERRVKMELQWLRDMVESLKARLQAGQEFGFEGMPKQPWEDF